MDLTHLATSPGWTLFFFVLAGVAWILAQAGKWSVNWVALGLIAALIPFAYTAAKAAF